MKKINTLELASIIIIQTVTPFFGICFSVLKENTGTNLWLSAIISYILGFIPILLILFISNYEPNLTLKEKITKLYGKHIGSIINIFLSIILVVLSITILYNINNFILSQFLYRTPFIISAILLMIVIIYCANKGINIIFKMGYLLLIINLLLYLINIFSLTEHIDISNFFPILKENTNNIFSTSLKILCINYLPLLCILTVPKNKLTIPKNYNKTIIISYIIGILITFGLIIVTFGVLGENLVNTFEYAEYIVLRKITLFGFLERIENIISLQWISGSFIYITLLIHTIKENIIIKNYHKTTNTIIGILLIILTLLIFKNNIIFDTYIKNILPYIIASLLLVYIIIIIKISISKKIDTN